MQNAASSDELSSLASIARDLLERLPGDRIPTVLEYQERLGIGSGTVQARLRTLESVGAIKLRSRGHLGTVLMSRDLADLWNLARLPAVRGVLPLPEAVEPVSLAAVLRREFQRLKIPLELLYLHGAERRVALVRQGRAHFAVLSRPAADEAIADDADDWTCRGFEPDSYHRADSMVVLLGPGTLGGERVFKVGIDPESHDHTLLTRLEFPTEAGYEHVEVAHARIPAAVVEGRIDAAVWLQATLAIPLSAVGVVSRPLRVPAAVEANEALGHAALIAPARADGVASVLAEVDVSGVGAVQLEILRSGALPLY